MTKGEEIKGIAILCILIAVMAFVPYTGYISYGGVNVTTIHIVVAVTSILYGKKGGIATGGIWGIMSFSRAYLYTESSSPIFMDPLVSIVPRIFVGILIGYLADAIRGKVDIKLYSITCGVVTSLANTILVVMAMGLFAQDAIATFGYTISAIFEVVISINGATELTLATIVTPIIIQQIGQTKTIKGYEDEKVSINEFNNQSE